MTDRERADRSRSITLCLGLLGAAVTVGAALGAAYGGLITLARWAGEGEWELT